MRAHAPGVNSPEVHYPETIKRIATYGSPVRTLYDELRNCGQGQIVSSIAADESYVYWLSFTGLYRLPTDANPGNPPQLVSLDLARLVIFIDTPAFKA